MEITTNENAYDEWRRYGRGKGFEFFATDDEIQQWLISALPHEYRPYKIITVDFYANDSSWSGNMVGVDELKIAMYDMAKKHTQFWIMSEKVSSSPNLSTPNIYQNLSLYGFINLQHGSYLKYPWNEGYAESAIGLVDKIQNMITGEIIEHTEYSYIFKNLKKEFYRHLCYSSIQTSKKGSKFENANKLISEGVVEQYNNGVKFMCQPGRPKKSCQSC